MTPWDLIAHAARLVVHRGSTEADHRRAASAAYYALFNALSGSAAAMGGADVDGRLQSELRRTFGHKEVRSVCVAYTFGTAEQRTKFSFIKVPVGPDLTIVAGGLVILHKQREHADYDLFTTVNKTEAETAVQLAIRCVGLWGPLERTVEGREFLTALLLFGRTRG